jgi:hypothetical protein
MPTLALVNPGQVLQRCADIGVVGGERMLANGEHAFEEQFVGGLRSPRLMLAAEGFECGSNRKGIRPETLFP